MRSLLHRIPLVPLVPMVLLLAGCPVPQRQDTPVSYVRQVDPATGRAFYLYVPSTYDPATPAPLVVTCHGTWPYDVAHDHIREWRMLGEQNGVIVVAPSLVGTDGLLGSGPVRQMLANEHTILSIISLLGYRYNIDVNNIMITGFSGGGYPMYWVGLRHPQLFSAIAARHCNFAQQNIEGWFPPEASAIPVLVYWGQLDPPPIHWQSRNAVQYLRSQGLYVTEKILPGVGHARHPEHAMEFFRANWRPPRPSRNAQ